MGFPFFFFAQLIFFFLSFIRDTSRIVARRTGGKKGRIEACFVLALSLGAWLLDFSQWRFWWFLSGAHRLVMWPYSITTNGGWYTVSCYLFPTQSPTSGWLGIFGGPWYRSLIQQGKIGPSDLRIHDVIAIGTQVFRNEGCSSDEMLL